MLGGRQDEVFGPVVLFGLGGILVEALGDVVWRVAPVTRQDATAMIRQIKGFKILTGMRGEAPSDLDSLEELIMQLSQILLDHPEIQEMDINPIKVGPTGQGSQALDARIILRP